MRGCGCADAEGRAPDEGLALLATGMGLFSNVLPLVLHQVGALAKDLASLTALLGLLAKVDTLVVNETQPVAEALMAFLPIWKHGNLSSSNLY